MTGAELTAETPPYAGLVRRGVAILLDLAVGWAAYSIAITALDPDVASEYATTSETALAAAIVLGTAILWLVYFVCAQWRWGQTLGMRAMRIRVVAESGSRLPWTRALLRTLLLVVDLAVGPLLIAASRRRQRLGDRLANTVVLVKANDDQGHLPRAGRWSPRPLRRPPAGQRRHPRANRPRPQGWPRPGDPGAWSSES